MAVRRELRRWVAVMATVAIVGLGTFGLHHLYSDALDGEHPAHDCMTCRVVGSPNAVAAAQQHPALMTLAVAAPVVAPHQVDQPGFSTIHGSRGPPTTQPS
jgi:hypothetical protein